MVKIRFEDIIFWLIIIAVIGVVIWMLIGSPPLENGLLMMVVFIATSEILLWKALFNINKKTSIGFIRTKHNTDKLRTDINNRFNDIDNKLIDIEKKLK